MASFKVTLSFFFVLLLRHLARSEKVVQFQPEQVRLSLAGTLKVFKVSLLPFSQSWLKPNIETR
jgi:hypothetical protein